jgi:hypothetical protein
MKQYRHYHHNGRYYGIDTSLSGDVIADCLSACLYIPLGTQAEIHSDKSITVYLYRFQPVTRVMNSQLSAKIF